MKMFTFPSTNTIVTWTILAIVGFVIVVVIYYGIQVYVFKNEIDTGKSLLGIKNIPYVPFFSPKRERFDRYNELDGPTSMLAKRAREAVIKEAKKQVNNPRNQAKIREYSQKATDKGINYTQNRVNNLQAPRPEVQGLEREQLREMARALGLATGGSAVQLQNRISKRMDFEETKHEKFPIGNKDNLQLKKLTAVYENADLEAPHRNSSFHFRDHPLQKASSLSNKQLIYEWNQRYRYPTKLANKYGIAPGTGGIKFYGNTIFIKNAQGQENPISRADLESMLKDWPEFEAPKRGYDYTKNISTKRLIKLWNDSNPLELNKLSAKGNKLFVRGENPNDTGKHFVKTPISRKDVIKELKERDVLQGPSMERSYNSLPDRNLRHWQEQQRKFAERGDKQNLDIANKMVKKFSKELDRQNLRAPTLDINTNKREKGLIIASNSEHGIHSILAVKEPYQINTKKTHVTDVGPGALKVEGENLAGHEFAVESAVTRGDPGNLEDVLPRKMLEAPHRQHFWNRRF